MKTFLIIIFISLFIFNANTNANIDYTSHPNDTVYDCYIMDIFNEGGIFYLKVRPIQIFTGLSAAIEARKDGNADYTIDVKSNDTAWFVSNDYYIAERVKNEFKLSISEDVKVIIYPYEIKKEISLDEFMANPDHYKTQLYDKYTYEKKESLDYIPYEIAIEKGNITIINQK